MGTYTGRFAPSPSGELHLGNLRTALLAWLHARLHGGRFLLRIEDLDTPRNKTGSIDSIQRDLEWLGLDWDGGISFQSLQLERYQMALEQLKAQGRVYPCYCSRSDIRHAVGEQKVQRYPGTCANLSFSERTAKSIRKIPAWRFRVNDTQLSYRDGWQGEQRENLCETCGDFVIKRADGKFAYQLSVVVDDLAQEISHVVRAEDLLRSTMRQRALAQRLVLRTPPSIAYFHAPLMHDEHGQKLSKRDGSQSLRALRATDARLRPETVIAKLIAPLQLFDRVAFRISSSELVRELSAEQFDSAVQQLVYKGGGR